MRGSTVAGARAEPCLSKTRRDLPVAFFLEDPELKAEVHVERADVSVDRVQPLLVDQERRNQTPDDHPVVSEVGELGGDVQADGPDLFELFGSVSGGSRRLHAGAFQVRYRRRSSSAASVARSG